ncbi:MAG: ABC transporter permease [Parvibaculaceae bacterium]
MTAGEASGRRNLRPAGLLPAMAAMGVFLVIPLGLVVVYSFLDKGTYGGVLWNFSLEAYRKILFAEQLDGSRVVNMTFVIVFARSLILAAATTAICALISFPAAYYISRRSAFAKGFLLLLIMFPFWSNLLVRTSSWIILFRDQGLINRILMGSGLTRTPLGLLYTDGAVLVGLVYVYLPFMILPVFTSIERLDRRLIEAAYDLYASKAQALRQVVLPLTRPGLIVGSILVFVPSLGAFITPELLGGGRKLMLGSLIQMQFTTARDWPYGAALSIILLVLVVATFVLTAARAGPRAARGG